MTAAAHVHGLAQRLGYAQRARARVNARKHARTLRCAAPKPASQRKALANVASPAVAATDASSDASATASAVVPSGRVVGVFERAWREYVVGRRRAVE